MDAGKIGFLDVPNDIDWGHDDNDSDIAIAYFDVPFLLNQDTSPPVQPDPTLTAYRIYRLLKTIITL